MSLYLAETGARAAQAAAKEAEEDLKMGLTTAALERLSQAKAEITDAIYRTRQHQRALKEQERSERAARAQRNSETVRPSGADE